MLHDRDIICISSIDWDFIWQGHQQIMSALAAQGNRVLFIENTGVRRPGLREVKRLRHRLARWWKSTRGFRQERENLYVFSPLLLPLPYFRPAVWLNSLLLLRSLRRWMRVVGFGRPVIWSFLPTPLTRTLVQRLDPALVIYYCVSDLPSSSHQARKIKSTEEKVFLESDLVFAFAEKLAERARRYSERVYLFPGGVDFDAFDEVRRTDEGPPADLAELPRPRVGYLGGLHQWVDQDLVSSAARRLPEATFVLVGPVQGDVERLRGCPNVRFLGARSHADVPRYLKGFDVGIVPYRLTEYTAHVYPSKLNEYLSMGLPVVATDLPEIRRFNADHGNVVTVARTSEEFAEGIRSALMPTGDGEVDRRIAVARENSWDGRLTQMSALIEDALARKEKSGAISWEERLDRIYRRNRRRALRLIGTLLVLYLALFWSPLPWIIAAPLFRSAPPVSADAIVVFGGGVGETGRGGEGYQERVQKAVELYRMGEAQHIIFSTGWKYTFHEARLMQVLAESLGVPAKAIVLEENAASTYQNVAFVSRILDRRGWRKILLVSSPYHMLRALLTFHRVAPGIRVVPTPAQSSFYEHHWGATEPQLRAILHEYMGIAYYWLKGWI